jgi:hypothetical protein
MELCGRIALVQILNVEVGVSWQYSSSSSHSMSLGT